MKVENGCGAPWLQSSFAKLSRLDLNSFCGLDRPQNCNPLALASQGIMPLDLASWLFIKTQISLGPAVTMTCVCTQGDERWWEDLPSREQPWWGKGGQDGRCGWRDATSISQIFSCDCMCYAIRGRGCGGLLTFGWLAIRRGQEL